MDRDQYAAQAKAMYHAPLESTETPKFQRFAIGTKVRFVTDMYAIYGAPKGTVGEIQYSYLQKYGRPGMEDAERCANMFSVKYPGNSIAWVMADELDAVEGS